MLLNILVIISIFVMVLIFVILVLFLGLCIKIEESNILYRIYLGCYSTGSEQSINTSIKYMASALACPHGAIEHFWHDGCPSCDMG